MRDLWGDEVPRSSALAFDVLVYSGPTPDHSFVRIRSGNTVNLQESQNKREAEARVR